jgi:hypothetical protein
MRKTELILLTLMIAALAAQITWAVLDDKPRESPLMEFVR